MCVSIPFLPFPLCSFSCLSSFSLLSILFPFLSFSSFIVLSSSIFTPFPFIPPFPLPLLQKDEWFWPYQYSWSNGTTEHLHQQGRHCHLPAGSMFHHCSCKSCWRSLWPLPYLLWKCMFLTPYNYTKSIGYNVGMHLSLLHETTICMTLKANINLNFLSLCHNPCFHMHASTSMLLRANYTYIMVMSSEIWGELWTYGSRKNRWNYGWRLVSRWELMRFECDSCGSLGSIY